MPFTFLSHQAAVLPLKIARPAWFCGVALAIGSMAPDLEYFIWLRPYRSISHTLKGQVLFCLPVTLLLVWLVTRVLARPLGKYLPDVGPFHLRDFGVLAEEAKSSAYWRKAVPSAFIGSFSHIVWDGFTHQHGWFARKLPILQIPLWGHGDTALFVSSVLQHLSTVGGAVLTVWMLYEIGRRRLLFHWTGFPVPATETGPEAQEMRRFWRPVAQAVPLGMLAGFARMIGFQDRPSGWGSLWNLELWMDGHVWLAMFFGAVTFSFLGLCLSCITAGQRMKFEAQR